jgi:hypothetical protein
MPLANWQNVLSKLPEGLLWHVQLFNTALKTLAARQEQKRLMKPNIGLPSNQLTLALLSQYSSSTGMYLTCREFEINASGKHCTMPFLCTYTGIWLQQITGGSMKNEKDSKVCSFFHGLLVIGSMDCGKKPKFTLQSIAHTSRIIRNLNVINLNKLTLNSSNRESPIGV